MSGTSGGRCGFGRLSALLVLVALALVGAGIARLLAHHAPLERAEPVEVTPLAEIAPEAGPAEPPSAPETPAAATAPPSPQLDPPTATAVEELAAELADYRGALQERERLLSAREAVAASLEARLGEQIARLEAASAALKQASGAVTAEERARLAQLVKVYEAMKAKNAAAIFDPMPLELLLPIVRGMRETKVAAVVAEMDPAKARTLTAELARSAGAPGSP
ncbi:MAG: hypothetical protein U1E52_07270 [Geminicoccaceae bacterium]